MRAPVPPFRDDIVAYLKKWKEDDPDDQPPPEDLLKWWEETEWGKIQKKLPLNAKPTAEDLALLKRWEKDPKWESCWEKIQKKLPPEVMPTAEDFIYLVLHRREVSKVIDDRKRRTPIARKAKRWAAAYLRDKTDAAELAKAHAELARDYDARARLNQMLAPLGRQKENIERKQFAVAWQDKFFELCGRPLNEVVLVMDRIVYGGSRGIGAIKGTRRATTRLGRKVDTRPKK
jgi:hypothetical protein